MKRLWITGEYKLSTVSQRFRIEVKHLPKAVEKAALQVDYIALETTGTITASALTLATVHNIPIVAVDFEKKRIVVLNQIQLGGVEYVLSQYYSMKYSTEYHEKIAEATVHNIRQLVGETTDTGHWKTDYILAVNTLNEYLRKASMLNEVEYALLFLQAELAAAIIKAKLSPHIGYLNRGEYGLVKDLTLLFAPPLLKTLLPRLTLVKQEKETRREILKHLKWSLETPVQLKPLEEHIRQEPKKLAQALRNPLAKYYPFKWS